MGTATTLHFASLFTPDGWCRDARVTVADGLVSALAMDTPPQPEDERHAVGFPGMPNLHSHAFQRGMAGLAEHREQGEDSFWTWREAMYRFVHALDPDTFEAIAALAYMEMLEAGFTRVGEFHYLHNAPDGGSYDNPARMAGALAAAAASTGQALTMLPVFYAQGGFGGITAGAQQRRFVTDPESYGRLLEGARAALAGLDDARLGIAPHSLRAVTPASLREVLALAPAGPVHIHIAEQEREVADCRDWSGARPVQWLMDNADVGADWCLVHATHVDRSELAAIARSKAVVGLCPITEANLGDGMFPAVEALGQGVRFGIGSDSNVRIDMTEELRLLEYGQRLIHRRRNCLAGSEGGSTGRVLFERALAGGQQALAAPSPLGLGSPADIVSLNADHPSLIGRSGDALLDGLMFAAGQGAIDCVWRRGIKWVEGGRHRNRDAIRARYRMTLEGLLA